MRRNKFNLTFVFNLVVRNDVESFRPSGWLMINEIQSSRDKIKITKGFVHVVVHGIDEDRNCGVSKLFSGQRCQFESLF